MTPNLYDRESRYPGKPLNKTGATPEEYKDMASQAVSEIFSKIEPGLTEKLYAPEHLLHDPSLPEALRGFEGVKRYSQVRRRAFPDARVTIGEQVAEGNRVVSQWTVTGTHQEDFMGIPATGVQVEVSGVTISRFSQGKIVEDWYSSDDLGMLWQLGVLSRPRQSEVAIATAREFTAESSEAPIVEPEARDPQGESKGSKGISLQSSEEYKIFLDHVDGLANRRQSVTTVYLSVNTAIIAVIAFLFRDGEMSGWVERVSVLALLVTGLVASGLWRRLIRQYSVLLGLWNEQLRTLEDNMPTGSKSITNEYNRLHEEELGKIPLGVTSYETWLTWLFTAVYFLFALGILVAQVVQFTR